MLSPCSITSAHRLMPAKAVGALSCFFLYTAFSSPRANSTSGSTGTHAGLLVGLKGENANIPLTGIGINRKKDAQRKAVYDHSVELAKHLGVANEITMDDVIVFDDYIGEGYSRVTKGMVKAVKLVARTEAILLDPVYTGKTMDGMLDLMQKGYFDGCKNILFVHTGGSPALFAYTDTFFPEE